MKGTGCTVVATVLANVAAARTLPNTMSTEADWQKQVASAFLEASVGAQSTAFLDSGPLSGVKPEHNLDWAKEQVNGGKQLPDATQAP